MALGHPQGLKGLFCTAALQLEADLLMLLRREVEEQVEDHDEQAAETRDEVHADVHDVLDGGRLRNIRHIARSAHPRDEDRGADCAACLHHQRDEGGDEAVDTDAGFVFADVDRITDNAVGMADTSTMHDLRNGESNEPEGAARSEEVADRSEQTAEAVAEDETLALVLQPTELMPLS